MKLSEILEKKTVGIVDLKTTLGDKYSNLDVELDAETSELFSKNFISFAEAENNAEIISKNKAQWHQTATKSLFDSIDTTLGDLTGFLDSVPEKTPAKVKATVDRYKQIVGDKEAELSGLKAKIVELEGKVNNNASPEMKAILEDKNYQIENLKKTTIALSEYDTIKAERENLSKKIKSIDEASLKDAIVTQALSTNMLAEYWKDNKMRNTMVVEAVKEYLKEETFGFGKTFAKIVFDENRQIKIVQKDNPDMPVIVDNKNIDLQEIVRNALIKNDMIQKSDAQETKKTFTSSNSSNKHNSVII